MKSVFIWLSMHDYSSLCFNSCILLPFSWRTSWDPLTFMACWGSDLLFDKIRLKINNHILLIYTSSICPSMNFILYTVMALTWGQTAFDHLLHASLVSWPLDVKCNDVFSCTENNFSSFAISTHFMLYLVLFFSRMFSLPVLVVIATKHWASTCIPGGEA